MNRTYPQAGAASRRLLTAAAAASLPFASAALAQTWTGGAGTPFAWADSANWSAAVTTSNTTDLTFDGTVGLTSTNNFTANSALRSLTFAAGAGAFTLGGSSIVLGPASGNYTVYTNASANDQTIDFGIRFSSANDRTFSLGTGRTLTLNGAIDFNGGRLFLNTTAGTLVLNGANTGLGVVSTIFGISGVNTTLRSNIAGTTIVLGNKTALGTAGADNGLQVNANTTLLANKSLRGAEAVNNALFIGNGAQLTIGGANDLEISGNVYNAGGNRTLLVNNTGETTLSGNIYLSDAAATSRTFTINVAATAGLTTLSGSIQNAKGTPTEGSSLTKSGTGTLRLTGTTTYSGTTTVSAGTLLINGTQAQSSVGTVDKRTFVNSGTTLGGNGRVAVASTLANNTAVWVYGTISPGDPLVANGLGTLTIDSSATDAATARAALTFESGARLAIDLRAGLQSDSLAIIGSASTTDVWFKTDGTNRIDFNDLTNGSLATGDYLLIDGDAATQFSGLTLGDAYAGTSFSGTAVTGNLTIGNGLASYTHYVDLQLFVSGNDLYLHLTNANAVPEPSTYAALAGLGALGYVLARRRRS